MTGRSDIVIGGGAATITVEVTEALPRMDCRLTISNSLGQPVTRMDSRVPAPGDVRDPALGTTIECEIGSLPLLPGRYRIDVGLRARETFQDGLHGAAYFDVEPGLVGGRPMPQEGAKGLVSLEHSWRLPA